jgi:hypothetical protein
VRYLGFNSAPARLGGHSWRLAMVERPRPSDGTQRRVRQRATAARTRAEFPELFALSLDQQQELESFASRSANSRPLGDPKFVALVERKLGPSWVGESPGRSRSMSRAETEIVYHVP